MVYGYILEWCSIACHTRVSDLEIKTGLQLISYTLVGLTNVVFGYILEKCSAACCPQVADQERILINISYMYLACSPILILYILCYLKCMYM